MRINLAFLSLLLVLSLCTCDRAPKASQLNAASAIPSAANDHQGPPKTGYSTPTEYPNRQLVWADEFAGTTLDTTNWTYRIGTSNNGWGNNELQYYRPDNTTVTDGHLVITARKENYEGQPYTSSRLVTQDKQEFKFGRIDIRAALPEGQGIWPALWMLGANFNQGSYWPRCGEIDIMEFLGHKTDTIYGTAHFQVTDHHGFSPGKIPASTEEDYLDAWHVYSIEWSPGRIEWFVDDVSYHALLRSESDAAPWPFDAPFFFLINLAVGGNWPGYPDETTTFPQQLYVDYVRVFQ